MINKILMIGPHTKSQGGIASVFSMYEAMPEIASLYTYIDGSKYEKLKFYFLSIFIFFEMIIKNKYTHLHIHSASRASFYRKSVFIILGKFLSKKIIFHLHGGEFDKFYNQELGKIKKYFIKSILKRCDFIFVVSSPWQKILSSLFPDIRIDVLHNPISQIYLNTSIENITQNKTILFIGRLDKAKGLESIVRVYAKIVEKYPDINLTFVGEGDRNYLFDITKKYGVENKIHLTGWLDTNDKIKFMQSSFVMFFPSHFETFGMSILESIAIGLPVVATNAGGIPDIVKDDYNGFLVKLGDEDKMLQKIEEIFLDKSLLKNLSDNAKISAEDFLFEKIYQNYLALIKEKIDD